MPTSTSSSISERNDRTDLVLGVDGGGTKTLAWLAARDVRAAVPLGCGLSGPSNPQAVGLATAQKNILEAIQRAFAAADLPPVPVAAACLALAGVGREPIRRAVLDWAIGSALAHAVRVVHDAQAVLAAGTRSDAGIAVICGTGSFAYGESKDGNQARSGGWGYLFGDEGSGYQVGCAGLRAVSQAADRRGGATSLTGLILDRLHVAEPAQLIPAIYGAPSARNAIAALAPLVFQAGAGGDRVAQQICSDAATELAGLVQSIARQLRFAHGQFDLALTGGVFRHQAAWSESITRMLDDQHCAPRATEIVAEPVAGAVVLAQLACRP